jgi:erythromycin esterase
MPRIRAAVLMAVVLLAPFAFAQKRRAATPPVADAHSVPGWLDLNAKRLVAVEPYPFTYDLESFGRLTGEATMVALGDDTHGTHEFFTVKHRLIDYLVRDKGFDVVAFEAPFTIFNRLNGWVQGGAGDPQAILGEADRLGYYFWYTEEILDLARSMREYNLHRGNKPAIEIAGFDVFGYLDESKEVIEYLRAVDPAAAVQAETTYACLTSAGSTTCEADVKRFHEQLAARRDELVPLSSARAYADALQSARIVTQRYNGFAGDGRDTSMTENALWLQQNRGTSHKIVLWAHQEHLGETKTKAAPKPMGKQLTAALGDANYFVVGTLAGRGTFLQWTFPAGEPAGHLGTGTFRDAPAESYEARFAEAAAPALLISLEGTLPVWLTDALSFRWAGSAPVDNKPDLVQKESLPAKFDAVIYVAVTTPARSLPH